MRDGNRPDDGGGVLTPSLHADVGIEGGNTPQWTEADWKENYSEKYPRGVYTFDCFASEYSADGYVTDGLIGHYDAIRNVGKDDSHDSTVTGVWKNLVDGRPDLTISGTLPSGAWTNGYGFFDTSATSFKINNLTIDGEGQGKEWTIEFVVDKCEELQFFVKSPFSIWASTVSKTFWDNRSLDKRYSGFDNWKGKYLTAVVDCTNEDGAEKQTTYLFEGTTYANPHSASAINSYNDKDWTFASHFSGDSGKCLYHAIRIYNRALTPEELAQNRLLDEARFHKKPNIEINTSIAGFEGDDKTGSYFVNGHYVFNVSETEKRVGRTIYQLAGYRLERYDATSDAWEFAEESSDTSFDYTNCTARANVRLTWLWQVKGRLRTATDYDVGDYVQEGLVAHYDAIRNVGAGKDHVSDTNIWVNLGTSGSTCDVTFKPIPTDGTVTPNWKDDAYSFDATSYGEMKAKLVAMDSNVDGTIQLAVDNVDTESVTKLSVSALGSRHFFLSESSWDHYGLTGVKSDSGYHLEWTGITLMFYAHSGKKLRPQLSDWDGKYITAIRTAAHGYLFQGTTTNGFEMTPEYPDTKIGSFPWCFGARHGGVAPIKADFHAVRFYNRVLNEAELEQNRKVDEIRFRGMVPTNIVVATKPVEMDGVALSGVEANGIYEVEGDWTFSAKLIKVGDKDVKPSGYKLEKWVDGAWVKTGDHSETSYDYNFARDGIMRLTWQYGRQGLCIIIR